MLPDIETLGLGKYVYCLLVPSVCCGSLCLVFEHYQHKLLWGFLNFVVYKRGQCYLCLMNKTCFLLHFLETESLLEILHLMLCVVLLKS